MFERFMARKRYSNPKRFRLGVALPFETDHLTQELDFLHDRIELRKHVAASLKTLVQITEQAIGSPGAVRPIETVQNFADLFDAEAEVVSLIAHSPDHEHVELLGNQVSWTEIAKATPQGFAGLIDLIGCDSGTAQDEILRRCKHAEVRGFPDTTDFNIVCWCYARTMRLVCGNRIPYDLAARQAWNECMTLGKEQLEDHG